MSELAGSGAPTLVPALAEAPAAVPKRIVLAWGLWDWGSASFNAVVTTFVFTVYLTTAEGRAPGGDATCAAQSVPANEAS